MWTRMTLGLAAAVALTACASAGTDGPADIDPVGSYTLTTEIQGTTVNGRLRIRGEPGAYTGSIYTDITGQLRITSLSVEGAQVLMTASTPDGPADIRLTFREDAFTGTWALGPDGGAIRGRRSNR